MHAWPHQIIRESDEVLFEDEPSRRFTVLAVHEDKCWISDREGEAIVPLARCVRTASIH